MEWETIYVWKTQKHLNQIEKKTNILPNNIMKNKTQIKLKKTVLTSITIWVVRVHSILVNKVK